MVALLSFAASKNAIVNLVVAVESDFGIKIKNEEIEHFISFNKIVSVLESKGL